LDSARKPRSKPFTLLYDIPALIGSLFFLLAGLAYLTLIGIENDEALFAGAFLKPYGEAYTVWIGHSRIPLMVMSYIGTLKAWLYRPLMRLFGTSPTVLRVPMLLAGAASGQTVDFLATTGALDLQTPLDFAGTIAGFAGSDTIDLLKTAATGLSYSGGTLTVLDQSATVATLRFSGSYTQSDFALTSDGHGGALIKFV